MPKIIVAACSMRGHMMPNVKLAQQLATLPDMEVYFLTDLGAPSDSFPKPPVKVLQPTEEQASVKGIQSIERVFAELALHPKTNDFNWSLYIMLKKYTCEPSPADPTFSNSRYYFQHMVKFIFEQALELKPTMMILENLMDYGDCMKPFAKRHDIKVVKVLNPGRPDPCFASDAIEKAFGLDLCNLTKLDKDYKKGMWWCSRFGGFSFKEYGKYPEFAVLLPGCKGFVETPTSAFEFFVGPFIEMPDMNQTSVADHSSIDFINSAGDEPVVYVAFGTLVVIQPILAKTLVAGLQNANCRVLWSIPEVQQSMLPAGLEAPKWCIQNFVPQTAVLRSEKVKCFISHCGSSSTHEAMSSGTPMISIPFYGDQINWSDDVTNHLKAGLTLDKNMTNPDAVTKAVTEVLTDPSFLQKAQAAKEIFSNECLSPEVPPGATGVHAAVRFIQSVLDGHDYLTPRIQHDEEQKRLKGPKNKCTIL